MSTIAPSIPALRTASRSPRFVAAVAAVVALTGVFVAPDRVWPNILLVGFYVTGLGLGAAFFIAVHELSGARWIDPLRPAAHALMRVVPFGAALVLAAIVFGGNVLYPSFHGHGGNAFKAVWLDRTFFTARAFIYAAVWIAFCRRPWKSVRTAAAFVVVFSVTVWLASFDWIMALDPRWSSTIFGVYHFAGLFTAALATLAVIAARDESIGRDTRHDLAKLLFGFATFWMYIWFSQYMLIWYGNLREEAGYYAIRSHGSWGVLLIASVLLKWVVPFVVLLSQPAKMSRTILLRVAIAVLAGHWLDLYVGIFPSITATPRFGAWEIVALGGAVAGVMLVVRQDD